MSRPERPVPTQEFLDSVKLHECGPFDGADCREKGHNTCNCIWLYVKDRRVGGMLHADIARGWTLCGMKYDPINVVDTEYQSPECGRCQTMVDRRLFD